MYQLKAKHKVAIVVTIAVCIFLSVLVATGAQIDIKEFVVFRYG